MLFKPFFPSQTFIPCAKYRYPFISRGHCSSITVSPSLVKPILRWQNSTRDKSKSIHNVGRVYHQKLIIWSVWRRQRLLGYTYGLLYDFLAFWSVLYENSDAPVPSINGDIINCFLPVWSRIGLGKNSGGESQDWLCVLIYIEHRSVVLSRSNWIGMYTCLSNTRESNTYFNQQMAENDVKFKKEQKWQLEWLRGPNNDPPIPGGTTSTANSGGTICAERAMTKRQISRVSRKWRYI